MLVSSNFFFVPFKKIKAAEAQMMTTIDVATTMKIDFVPMILFPNSSLCKYEILLC